MTKRTATGTTVLFGAAILAALTAGCYVSINVDEANQIPAARGKLEGSCERVYETAVPLEEQRLVSLTIVDGQIDVESWDRPELRVTATKTVRAETDQQAEKICRAIEIDVAETEDGVQIVTTMPRESSKNSRISVSFLLLVPPATDLELATTNGSIAVREVVGRHDIAAVNGSAQLTDVGGDVEVATVNGNICTVFQYIDLSRDDITLESVNGEIIVELTEDASVKIDATAANGSISSAFDLIDEEFDKTYGHTRLRGHLGEGEGTLEISVTNGSIHIE
ncbi:hypothetical protein AMJ71_04870 [candidate division TA06 bacterium SM1_40]|jgi:DUF4097 and DUF4098 domain-containing protein YvlB|uniref:DUF4097 domain-containing protein n=2 Tax=Bacteria division TA06 TaxID=1156500 RepID=A0A0S8JK37_UNCT6|nr:MAG: hypothetical protein AMJ82_05345 [candidate division TA06 bacterium SM23_40]KPL09978.1 MAG: hypothetical protein AMJ71_04870 [candidate division TA06 bacterium SM1_40]